MPAVWDCVATLVTEKPVNCLLPDPLDPDRLWYGMYAHLSDAHREGGLGSWSFRGGLEEGGGLMDLRSQYLQLPGVFDLTQTTSGGEQNTCDTLVCCTDGSVRGVRRAVASSSAPIASLLWHASVDDEMITSCCELGSADDTLGMLGCSSHLGKLTMMTRGADGGYELLRKWQGHEFDAWCVASHLQDADRAVEDSTNGLMWSGGDDGTLALWDVRAPASDELSAVMRRRFDAGVVTIVVGATAPHELIVGSYDEHLFVLDRRALKRPLSSVSVGGGAWRCRPVPGQNVPCNGSTCSRFVVAAMQGGASIVEWDPTSTSMTVLDEGAAGCEGLLHSVDEHPAPNGSEGVLVYDAMFLNDGNTIATASFYNQTIKIWERRSHE
jgi:WD40 repeat protein